MRIAALVLAAYVSVGFLTGGHYYNHRCGDSVLCTADSVAAGWLWPAYWAGRGSVYITR